MGQLDVLDEPLAATCENREHPEVELVDEVVADQCSVDLARAELQDVLPGLVLELGNFLGQVSLDDRGVPGGLLERVRGDVLRKAVDAVGVLARPRRPRLDEALVGHSSQQESVGREQQVVRVARMLVVPVRGTPLLGSADDSVQVTNVDSTSCLMLRTSCGCVDRSCRSDRAATRNSSMTVSRVNLRARA